TTLILINRYEIRKNTCPIGNAGKVNEVLTKRKQDILKAIVTEYIGSATPVPSETIARKYNLNVSTATIRNEMSLLEQEGYIGKPHTSAGSVPLDIGYRYYVESLLDVKELPSEEQFLIQHLFHQVERHLDEWTRLAAAILSRMVRNAAVVTMAKAPRCRFRQVELVSIQQYMSLLVLVLNEAKIKQQFITFDTPLTQEDLWVVSNKLNRACSNSNYLEIIGLQQELSSIEKQVMSVIASLMKMEDTLNMPNHTCPASVTY
ncbi:MAG: heat-inducible transcriptional repressor HrcA, partial [Dehalococcoidia bacterium]|nr:heat-inducible transcriptional repressor HrcA [Dehalococcoidia bacterium]